MFTDMQTMAYNQLVADLDRASREYAGMACVFAEAKMFGFAALCKTKSTERMNIARKIISKMEEHGAVVSLVALPAPNFEYADHMSIFDAMCKYDSAAMQAIAACSEADIAAKMPPTFAWEISNEIAYQYDEINNYKKMVVGAAKDSLERLDKDLYAKYASSDYRR